MYIPRQTQQKSALQAWFLQIIWLQPPSFSMVALQVGHSLVFADIQLDVSESSSHFLIHFLIRWQRTGSCQFSEQAKQNLCPHRHVTGRDSTWDTLIALVQSGLGHHLKIMNQHLQSCILIPNLIVLLHCTKLSVISCWYLTLTLGSSRREITWGSTFNGGRF